MIHRIRTFGHDENGATAVEYAILVLAVALAIVAATPLIGQKLQAYFTAIIAGWSS